MGDFRRRPSDGSWVFTCCIVVAALAVAACGDKTSKSHSVAPVIAGLSTEGIEPRVRGLVLLGELGCVACHEQEAGRDAIDRRRGPDLATVGARLRDEYLTSFIADPRGIEAGTVMPHVLGDDATGEVADALAQYLRSFTKDGGNTVARDEPAPWDEAAAARGRDLFRTIGCQACHAPRNDQGVETRMAGSVPLGRLGDKYRPAALEAFLLAPHLVRPDGRMPDFHLSPGEAHDLRHFLMGKSAVAATTLPLEDDKVAAGRQHFAELLCARCHDVPDPEPPASRASKPLRELDTSRGCLSSKRGAWPRYDLTDEQVRDIRSACAALDETLDAGARIQHVLAARNCYACHDRDQVGGVSEARNRFFTTKDRSVGEEGRLPPTLTNVGAKLQHAWLVDAIAAGQAERPYLATRMPGFGVDVATTLAGLFSASDALPPVELRSLPEDEKAAQAVRELGRELVGDKGMNCISCHSFAGARVGGIAALDLVDSTGQRLRPEWFAAYLRRPFDFKPNTLMPHFFPDGVSLRPELGDGDVARQIDALWQYLSQGRNVRKPSGMRTQPIEVVVGSEAVLLRRSLEKTGKRGISVGYPGAVNIGFDAESLALQHVWWGRFIDAAPVWTGQGSGQARILGKERVTLPTGPAFAELPAADAPWPEVTRRDLGHRWLGYDLDPEQRPTFRYTCRAAGADVDILDTPREAGSPGADVLGVKGVLLRRSLRLSSPVDVTLYFRAAVAERIEDAGDGRVRVGPSLLLSITGAAVSVLELGGLRELRLEVEVRRDAPSDFVIEYAWNEEGK